MEDKKSTPDGVITNLPIVQRSEAPRPFDAASHVRRIKTRQGNQDYLDVRWRVIWLRSEHPDASVVTEMVYANSTEALFKATISYQLGERVVRATGHGSETAADFPGGHIEKAETKAIGRACAVLGYGTDSATDFDDGEPVDGRGAAREERASRKATPEERGEIDAQHARNLPQGTPAPATSSKRPSDADPSNVHQHAQVRMLAEAGFPVSERLAALGLESIESLTVGQAKAIIVEGRAATRAPRS